MAIPDRRNGRYSPKSDDSRDIRHRHRSRSPSYARYSPELRRRRNPSRSRTPPPPPDDSRDIRRRNRSRSPSYARYSPELSRRRNPSRSRTPPLPPPPPYRKPLPVRDNYNNRRERGNYGRIPDNESDEELRDLSFEEYRRLKRQKLRRNPRHCIWQVTPSPPRSQKDAFRDGFDENQDDAHDDDDDVIPPRSGSGSGSGSGSDSRLKSRGKKNGRVRGKESESDSDTNTNTDSESGSKDSDSGSRKRSRKRRHKRKKSSRSRRKSSRKSSDSEEDDESEDGDDSSEEDRKKRKSKSKRGSSGRRKKSSRKRRKRRRSSKSETEDESESEGQRRRKRNKKKVVRESSEEGSDSGRGNGELEIEEAGLKIDETGNVDDDEINPEVLKFKVMLEAQKMEAAMVNEQLVGPQPLPKAEGHISYGGALRPGEGDAIAQYVQQGKRIPRRGEVGLSADEISKFEDLGYVMSGSRHQRMNAIRIRKENQVYSAEDKRALAMYNFEEKAKREGKVMTDLKRLVQRTIGQEVAPNHDPFGAKDEGDVEP